jgi:hypothetical protein
MIYLAGLISLCAILIYLVMHLVAARIFKMKDPFILLNRAVLVFVPLVFISSVYFFNNLEGTSMMAQPSQAQLIILANIVLIFLFLPYLSFYSMLYHAVRTRILVQLWEADGKPLSFSALIQRYDPLQESLRRLDELVRGGFLTKKGGSYCLTSKGIKFAKLQRFCRALFNLP